METRRETGGGQGPQLSAARWTGGALLAGALLIVVQYRRRTAQEQERLRLEGKIPITPYESLAGTVMTALPRSMSASIGICHVHPGEETDVSVYREGHQSIGREDPKALFLPTLYWNRMWSFAWPPQNWWDQVDEHVLLGALPTADHVPQLHAAGVRAVVNTCDEYLGPCEAYASHGIEQLHIRTVDYTAPSLEDIARAVQFMHEAAARQERVYVHCKAGRGRSATVVLCYLMERHGLAAREGQTWLLRVRPHVSRHLYRRPVVLTWETRVRPPAGSQPLPDARKIAHSNSTV